MHSWSNPPDLCLLTILAHIPLTKLIRTFGLVCKYWARLQRDELNRRRTLVLVPRSHDLETLLKLENSYGNELIRHVRRDDGCFWIQLRTADDIKRDVVEIPDHDKYEDYVHFYESLLRVLPSITHLTIVRINLSFPGDRPKIGQLYQMSRLLTHFNQSVKLISLKIEFEAQSWLPQYDTSTTLVNDLIESINKLKSLQHLTLNVPFGHSKPTSQLSILSQLKSFTVHHSTPSDFLIDSLRQYATGNVSIRSIDFGTDMTLEQMFSIDRQLAQKFVRVSVANSLILTDYQNFRLFCVQFSSLFTLKLHTRVIPMSMLAQCLAQLHNLIHLDLSIPSIPQQEKNDQMTRVPSVRLLTMYIATRSHRHTEHLHPAAIFPNLQVLNLKQKTLECNECQFSDLRFSFNSDLIICLSQVNGVGVTDEHRQLIEKCIGMARQPFRDCAKLHTIELKSYGNLGPQGLITRDQL